MAGHTHKTYPYGFWDHLYIELTDRCNLKCKHCYLLAGPHNKHTLKADIVRKALADFKAMGGRSVALSGGEPLLHPELETLVAQTVKQGLLCTVVTNGTLLTEKRLWKLLEMGAQIALSIEGWCAETHDSIRGSGNAALIQKILNTLTTIEAQPRTIVCFTPMKVNLSEFSFLIKKLANNGFVNFYLSLLEERGRQKRFSRDLTLNTEDKVQLLIELSLLLTNPLLRIHLDTGHLSLFFGRLLGDIQWDGHYEFIEGTLRITAMGDVYLSAYSEGNLFRLGNLYLDSLKANCSSAYLYDLLAKLYQRSSDIAECESCPYRIICGGGSAARAYTKYQDMMKPDDFCQAKKRFLDKWFLAI